MIQTGVIIKNYKFRVHFFKYKNLFVIPYSLIFAALLFRKYALNVSKDIFKNFKSLQTHVCSSLQSYQPVHMFTYV